MGFGSLSYSVERKLLQEGAFIATTEFNPIPSVNEHAYMLLRNPGSSELKCMVTHLSSGVDSTSVRSTIGICANPTVTADGTVINIQNTHIKTSPESSQMECFLNPTVSDFGTKMTTKLTQENSGSGGLNRFFLLDPGNSVLICIENDIANCDTFAELLWLEI